MGEQQVATKPKKDIRVGVLGSGTASTKSIKSLLTDFIAEQSKKGNLSFVLPVTTELFHPGVKAVADVLVEQEVPFDVVTDAKGARSRNLKPYTSNAAEIHEGERGLAQKVVTIASKGDVAFLVVLFDEDDASLEKAIEKAWTAEIEVRDLTQGMGVVEAADDEDEDDEEDDDAKEEDDDEEDDDDEEPAPKKPSSKGKAAASRKSVAKDDDEDDEDEDDDEPAAASGTTGEMLIAIGKAFIIVGKELSA